MGFSCGYAAFDSVAPDLFEAHSRFSGTLHEVAVDLSGDLITNDEAAFRNLLVEQ